MLLSKKATIAPFALTLVMFLIASVTVSYLFLAEDDAEAVVGTNALTASSLINEAEAQLLYLDALVHYSSSNALNDLSLKWFNKNCNKFEDYIILNQPPCLFNEEQLQLSFSNFFENHLASYLSSNPYELKNKYNFDYSFSPLIVYGKAFYTLKFSNKTVNYEVSPDFEQSINFNFTLIPAFVNEALSKKDCLKQISFNQLTDSQDKLIKACNFSSIIPWNIKKKDNYALFDIKLKENNLYFRFAISLNTN